MLDSLKADIVSKYKQTDRAMAPKANSYEWYYLQSIQCQYQND